MNVNHLPTPANQKIKCPECGLRYMHDSGVSHIFMCDVQTCDNCRAFFVKVDDAWVRLPLSDKYRDLA